ncbi:MAG TPA: SRPBCC domain-containing protein [Candidatus Acidoferrales bacterium]|nr:SRPBCC domain-containing protein [Candidatus Acidoferrales bacterium]HEV2490107.1 SRPBCC domain-containing protein [Candidatus Acidoferrales bacterium]
MNEERLVFVQTHRPSRRQMIAGAAATIGGVALAGSRVWGAADPEISHTAEAIHQEPVFKASPKRVYETLMDAKEFDKVVRLSGAMQSGMITGDTHTEINAVAGGAFSLFTGVIVGRQIELVPNVRIVEAWRAADWKPGAYSIVKFELAEEGAGTRIVFDHTGFPAGEAEHLAEGWKVNYWEPLAKVLA